MKVFYFILNLELYFNKDNIINLLSTDESLKQTYKDIKITLSFPYFQQFTVNNTQNIEIENEEYLNNFNDEISENFSEKILDDNQNTNLKIFDNFQNLDFLQLGKTSYLKNNITNNSKLRVIENLEKQFQNKNSTNNLESKNSSSTLQKNTNLIDQYSLINLDMTQLNLFNIL
jgi:hypothetical protein